jgi:hypothetical protein
MPSCNGQPRLRPHEIGGCVFVKGAKLRNHHDMHQLHAGSTVQESGRKMQELSALLQSFKTHNSSLAGLRPF